MSYKNFVSHSVIDNNQEQVLDSKEANDSESASTKQPEIEYDPRTLYERLQEQKTKKEDEFREATRFSNLVKRVDPDEAAYYKSLSDTQQQLDEDLKLKEMNELEEYRRAVEQARAPPVTSDTTATTSSSVSTTMKRRKSSLDNVTKPKKNPLGDLVMVKKKRGAEHDNNDEDKERQHKKTKQQDTPPKSTKNEGSSATTKTATTGLTSLLAAYDDDSNSDSD